MTNLASATTQSTPSTLQGLVLPPDDCCFHCGDPVPTPPFYATVLGESRKMCCMGCQLAAQSIVEADLEQYYLDRSEINRTASLPKQMTQLQAYDNEDIKAQFVYEQEGMSVAELSVNNLRCAACTWLIESRLYEMDGIKRCQVNLTSQRMRVVWDESKLPISEILAVINRIGYDAKPYRQDTHEAMLARHNKTMLIRLGIAALGAMQSMMFAVGMYFGNYGGMLIEHRDFLRWVSLFVSIPVFFYASIPFFVSAYTAIKARQVNMDVPVSIALIVTFFASLYATISGQGETYYDSVSMFVFFLLAGRYIEHNARLTAANMANDLVVLEPTLIRRLGNKAEYLHSLKLTDGSHDKGADISLIANLNLSDAQLKQLEQLAKFDTHNIHDSSSNTSTLNSDKNNHSIDADEVVNAQQEVVNAQLKVVNTQHEEASQIVGVTAQSLQVGDVIYVGAGDEVMADGVLCSDTATLSQSLLTGESDLIVKKRGDVVVGGSQNDAQPFVMIVTTLPEDSQIGLIDRLMNRALSEKPKIAEQADKWAKWFVARILILSALVFIGWYWIDPSKAIWATVAVLVATCPCALSLATPIALTVSTNRLATYGFLTTRGHTIQTLSEVTHIAFDKTGTLTFGQPTLLFIESLTPHALISSANKDQLLAIAAAMEVGSRHPIAHALLQAAYQLHLPVATDITPYTAGGIEATIDDDIYRLGHFEFALDAVVQEGVVQKSVDQENVNQENVNKDIGDLAPPDVLAHKASMSVVLSRYDDTQARWQALAYFYFNDKVRPDVEQMIADIKATGITPLMLTGDPSDQALITAKELGIDEAYHAQTPSQKVEKIQQLQHQGAVVMMVGDGINDAPVIAAANVSSAMAGAADLAQVSSDSVILNGKIEAVMDAKRIADKAQLIIKQNLYWALGYNAVVLLPAAFGYVPPWLAAIGMSFSSFVVVLNALRLKRA